MIEKREEREGSGGGAEGKKGGQAKGKMGWRGYPGICCHSGSMSQVSLDRLTFASAGKPHRGMGSEDACWTATIKAFF